MRKLTKKMTAWMMAAAMVAPMSFSNPVVANASENEATSANIVIRSQTLGGFIHGIESAEVNSDLAESYDLVDNVENGVSALDALVKAHEITFGEAFTSGDTSDFLVVSNEGYVTKLFGEETEANGFFVNSGCPNDGTESSWGEGYNGTNVNTTAIEDGDVVDFFIYQDASTYSDMYSFVEFDDHLVAGEEVSYTVYGTMALMGYEYETPSDFYNDSEEVEGVKLAFVDAETGAVMPIECEPTDEDGASSFEVPEEVGEYYITAYSDDEDVPIIMNPYKAFIDTKPVHDKNYPYNLIIEDEEATCEEEGNTGDIVCYICDKVIERGETIPKTPHTLTHNEGVAATCIAQGEAENWYCEECENYFLTEDATKAVSERKLVLDKDPANHAKIEKIEAVEATCETDGKTEGTRCAACDTVVKEPEVVKASHKWDAGKVTKEATVDAEGEMTYTCEVCKKTKTEAISKKEAVKEETPKTEEPITTPNVPAKENVENGTVVEDTQNNAKFQVADVAKKEVTYVAPIDAKATTIVVPATIKVNGEDYKVTKIADNAFKGNKKIKKVTIGKNITTIGKKAFYKCTALTSITIPASVTKIGKSAFEGCKKLKKVTIKTTKLTTKNVGSKAFKGIAAKAKVKVPKKKLSAYKKMLKKKGLPKKATVKK